MDDLCFMAPWVHGDPLGPLGTPRDPLGTTWGPEHVHVNSRSTARNGGVLVDGTSNQPIVDNHYYNKKSADPLGSSGV